MEPLVVIPPRETQAVFLFYWILFLSIPFVLPFRMTFFFSDVFHFLPSFALLSFLISLIIFLSLYFFVNFFLFSSPFISSVLVCPFVSYYFVSAIIYLLTPYSLPSP